MQLPPESKLLRIFMGESDRHKGRPLYEVGHLAMGDRLRLLDAREVKLDKTAPLILDMTGASPLAALGSALVIRPPRR